MARYRVHVQRFRPKQGGITMQEGHVEVTADDNAHANELGHSALKRDDSGINWTSERDAGVKSANGVGSVVSVKALDAKSSMVRHGPGGNNVRTSPIVRGMPQGDAEDDQDEDGDPEPGSERWEDQQRRNAELANRPT